MDVIGRNNEGDPKPTVSEEVWNAAMEKSSRPIVYICSPYSSDVDRNIEKAYFNALTTLDGPSLLQKIIDEMEGGDAR